MSGDILSVGQGDEKPGSWFFDLSPADVVSATGETARDNLEDLLGLLDMAKIAGLPTYVSFYTGVLQNRDVIPESIYDKIIAKYSIPLE